MNNALLTPAAARRVYDRASDAAVAAYLNGEDASTLAQLGAAKDAAWTAYLSVRLAVCGW